MQKVCIKIFVYQYVKLTKIFWDTQLFITTGVCSTVKFYMIYSLPAIGLWPGGSSRVHIYTKQQYTEQHNNTENTVRNIYKNTTDIQYTHDKGCFDLGKINQKRICSTKQAQNYKR
jgi:hypothetical protein